MGKTLEEDFKSRLERDKEIISRNIKYFRKKLGYLQTDLAQKLNVSLATIRRWEAGEAVPKALQMMRLGAALRCSPDDLYKINVTDSGASNSTNDFMSNNAKESSVVSKSISVSDNQNNQTRGYVPEFRSFSQANNNVLIYEDKNRKILLPATEEGYKILRELIKSDNDKKIPQA